jgi:hypothetical protein
MSRYSNINLILAMFKYHKNSGSVGPTGPTGEPGPAGGPIGPTGPQGPTGIISPTDNVTVNEMITNTYNSILESDTVNFLTNNTTGDINIGNSINRTGIINIATECTGNAPIVLGSTQSNNQVIIFNRPIILPGMSIENVQPNEIGYMESNIGIYTPSSNTPFIHPIIDTNLINNANYMIKYTITIFYLSTIAESTKNVTKTCFGLAINDEFDKINGSANELFSPSINDYTENINSYTIGVYNGVLTGVNPTGIEGLKVHQVNTYFKYVSSNTYGIKFLISYSDEENLINCNVKYNLIRIS